MSSYNSTVVLLNCSISEVRPTFNNTPASVTSSVEKNIIR